VNTEHGLKYLQSC